MEKINKKPQNNALSAVGLTAACAFTTLIINSSGSFLNCTLPSRLVSSGIAALQGRCLVAWSSEILGCSDLDLLFLEEAGPNKQWWQPILPTDTKTQSSPQCFKFIIVAQGPASQLIFVFADSWELGLFERSVPLRYKMEVSSVCDASRWGTYLCDSWPMWLQYKTLCM